MPDPPDYLLIVFRFAFCFFRSDSSRRLIEHKNNADDYRHNDDDAEHTDELKADGKIHLRIDYKNSGIGSGSCGPLTQEKYQLNEKEIDFEFSVKPI